MQAMIKLSYPDVEMAAAVARAVSPENAEAPSGLVVQTRKEGATVVTEICLEGKLATLVATIDDLLEAASTAEKALHVARQH